MISIFLVSLSVFSSQWKAENELFEKYYDSTLSEEKFIELAKCENIFY
jgi:hypothetical protein